MRIALDKDRLLQLRTHSEVDAKRCASQSFNRDLGSLQERVFLYAVKRRLVMLQKSRALHLSLGNSINVEGTICKDVRSGANSRSNPDIE